MMPLCAIETSAMSEYGLPKNIPVHCLEAVAEFLAKRKTGQILLNVNRGEIQSFELKEHHRIQSFEKQQAFDRMARTLPEKDSYPTGDDL
jgi:hypothetical protein